MTLIAAVHGNADVPLLADHPEAVECPSGRVPALLRGRPVTPGEYTIVDQTTEERHGPIQVPGLDASELVLPWRPVELPCPEDLPLPESLRGQPARPASRL